MQWYTRVYILEFLGGSYFADKSGEKVHLMFLPMLEDFMLLDGIVRVVQF